jgi:hypothetical protein
LTRAFLNLSIFLWLTFVNIQIDPDVTIGDKGMDSGVGDAVIGAVGIVTGVAIGRDGFGATAFAFDAKPRFDGTNEGTCWRDSRGNDQGFVA